MVLNATIVNVIHHENIFHIPDWCVNCISSIYLKTNNKYVSKK